MQVNKMLGLFDKQNIEYVRELFLRQILQILLGRIYEVSLRMRYQMLLNQLDYAKNLDGDICRRIILKGIFTQATPKVELSNFILADDWGEITSGSGLVSLSLNSLRKTSNSSEPTLLQEQVTVLQNQEDLVTDNYRCEFCDICNLEFEFTHKKAVNPIHPHLSHEITEQLTLLFDEFNAPFLQKVLSFILESQAVKYLFARVTNRLEREPTNLSALYLAGAIARLLTTKSNLAFDYLQFGFFEGKKQGLLPENLLLFYQEAAQLNPEEAFSWLTQVGGDWDSREGLKFLIQEAASRFGKNSRNYRVLAMLWQIRHLNQVNDDCNHIKPAIAILKFGFRK
ncbi:MAG: hypothetical protein HC908_00570 [Calothrix sp. SM1_7_51]|nr:hypothetical protein [Calothrix sp. SM1_7_51]